MTVVEVVVVSDPLCYSRMQLMEALCSSGAHAEYCKQLSVRTNHTVGNDIYKCVPTIVAFLSVSTCSNFLYIGNSVICIG